MSAPSPLAYRRSARRRAPALRCFRGHRVRELPCRECGTLLARAERLERPGVGLGFWRGMANAALIVLGFVCLGLGAYHALRWWQS